MMSALPPRTDILWRVGHVRKVGTGFRHARSAAALDLDIDLNGIDDRVLCLSFSGLGRGQHRFHFFTVYAFKDNRNLVIFDMSEKCHYQKFGTGGAVWSLSY